MVVSESYKTARSVNTQVLALAASRSDRVNLDAIDIHLSQQSLSHAIDQDNSQHLLSTASSSRFRPLALSSSLSHANYFLNVVPLAALGLYLQDREFH